MIGCCDVLLSFTITGMDEPRELLRDARRRAGLSTRALARLAGVSLATVARIEAGTADPTVGMLRRLLAASGEEMVVRTEPKADPSPALARLADAWTRTAGGDVPDWTRLRALLDYLAHHPVQVPDAIAPPPRRSGSRVMDALLAGIAEKLADDTGLPRPSWVRSAPRLKAGEWPLTGTPRMVAAWRARTPVQLAARGIVVDAASLWRDRVGAHG